MTSPNKKIYQKLVDEKINNLMFLAAENQRMKDYLNHIGNSYSKLKGYMDKIESSRPYKIWSGLKLFVNKPFKWYSNALLSYEFWKWGRKRMPNSFDILIYAVIGFSSRHQRPQHLALGLAKRGHRIFYIEPDFTYKSNGVNPEPLIRKVQNNLYIVKLSSQNKDTKKLFVYYGEISEQDRISLVESVKCLIKKVGISQGVIKVDNPSWTFIMTQLNLPIIYDHMDDHQAIETNPENIADTEKNIVRQSDAVIVASTGLAEKIGEYKHHFVKVIGNAGEYNHFAMPLEHSIPIPRELKKIKLPILGYCGAIAEWFDVNLLETIVKTFPLYSIVLIGSPDNQAVRELAQKYLNIHILGEKNYQSLPMYYKKFSVCLIPFIINGVTKNLNPVKIYEYLATGKPVVTTNIPGLKQFKEYIYLSKDAEEFCNNIRKALFEKDTTLSQKRQHFAKENTWEERTKQLELVIKKVLEQKE